MFGYQKKAISEFAEYYKCLVNKKKRWHSDLILHKLFMFNNICWLIAEISLIY